MNDLQAVRRASKIEGQGNNFVLDIRITVTRKGFFTIGSPGCEKANPVGTSAPVMWRVAAVMRFVAAMVEDFICQVERRVATQGGRDPSRSSASCDRII